MPHPPEKESLILIVDDEPANLAAMSALLKPHFRVRVAKSGAKALSLAESIAPDLVLLDVDMPELDGYETCRRLKHIESCINVPVVFVTGMRSEEAEEKGFAAGGVDYVHKPVSPALLIARVKTHLSHRRAVAEANRLLDVLMPPVISKELRETGTVAPRVRAGVAVLFADLVGFTRWCNQRSAEDVVTSLQEVMTLLEDISDRHGVEKLKTIGDAFMAAAGLIEEDPSAFERTVRCGIEMAEAIDKMDNDWRLRVGVQIGPVVAGIIGRQRFRFDVWGDIVNQASRFCDLAKAGQVCIAADKLTLLDAMSSDIENCEVSGVGMMALAHLSH